MHIITTTIAPSFVSLTPTSFCAPHLPPPLLRRGRRPPIPVAAAASGPVVVVVGIVEAGSAPRRSEGGVLARRGTGARLRALVANRDATNDGTQR